MERKDIDWGNLGFGYVQTDMRYVSNFRNGQWDDGCLTDQATITMSECACVLQYAQTCFEGLKAYTTEDGHIVCFRPDLNAQRMASSCRRLKMPVFPEDRFVQAVVETVLRALEQAQPALAADVYDNGLLMAGGGALLRGLDQCIARATHLKVAVDKDPLTTVLRGTAQAMLYREDYEGIFIN